MKTIRYFLLTGLLVLSCSTFSQAQERFKNRYAVGIAFSPEWHIDVQTLYDKFSPTFGITGEAQFDKYNGMEFGMFYRTKHYPEFIPPPWGEYPEYWDVPPYNSYYLALRLGYKFYSKFVNASVAFNCDLWITGKQKRYQEVKRYGIYLSLSKDILLYKGLILEPEIHYNPFWADQNPHNFAHPWGREIEYEGSYVGGGVKLKYRF